MSPLIAACNNFASVGKVMALGCTVVSTVTRAKSRLRNAPLVCATRKLSASSGEVLTLLENWRGASFADEKITKRLSLPPMEHPMATRLLRSARVKS